MLVAVCLALFMVSVGQTAGQTAQDTTYGKPCNISGVCSGLEICILDGCNSRKCSCGYLDVYNNKTCEKKKRFGETCSSSEQCSTWLSVCDMSKSKPVCSCRNDEIFDSSTDSCTNIVPCPMEKSYINFFNGNSCYKIKRNLADNAGWDGICTEPNSAPLHLTSSMRDHMVNRLWNLGYYTRKANQTNRLEIILSTNYSASMIRWYWPDGGVLSLDKEIKYPTNWPSAGLNEGQTVDSACLSMVYDGAESDYEASMKCNHTASYKGCIIQLPKAFCKEDVDSRNTTWIYTEGGTVLTVACPAGYKGLITRECGVNGVFKPAYYNCSLVVIDDIQKNLNNGTIEPSEALEKLKDVTTNRSNDELYIGDLLSVQDLLENVVVLSKNTTISENTTKNFLDTASFLVDNEKNGNQWQSRVEKEGKGAEGFLTVVDNFVKQASESLLKANQTSLNVEKPNIVLQFSKVESNDQKATGITFPTGLLNSEDWGNKTPSRLHLDHKAFQGKGVDAFSIVLYKNLSNSIPSKLVNRPNDTSIKISSQVLSVQLLPAAPDILDPAIEFDFQAFQDLSSSRKYCSSWNTEKGSGQWSTEGCRVTFSNDTVVRCSCSHLTNFALLISPYVPDVETGKILSIITIVGCAISSAGLLITIVLHAVYWRALKSDKTIVTMCLCVTLLLGNLLFIGAASQTASKGGCTAVAIILHYIFLAVFFLMLAEGVNVFIAIVFVFHKKSHLLQLLALAFGLPVLIVAISMGSTQLEGYGANGSCWLSRDNGLFWAFAAPAVLIIVLNYVIIAVLLKTMFKTTSFVDKTTVEKAKVTALALAVLTPVTGITWIVGIFSINEDTVWLQYVFCIFNSLQGVLICIFHCIRNKQLHQAMKASRKRKESIQEFDSGFTTSIKKKFAGLKSFKNRTYEIMSKHKAGSDAGYSSVQFTSQTEQTEFLSNSESVGFENKAYDMSSTIKTKVDTGTSGQDQCTNDKRESIGEKKTTVTLEPPKQDKEIVQQIEAHSESASRETSVTDRIGEKQRLQEGERSAEQDKEAVEEQRQRQSINSSSRTDVIGNKTIFDEEKKEFDNTLESKRHSQIKEVSLQSDRKSKETGKMPSPQPEPETATMVTETKQQTNSKDDARESESNDANTRRASDLQNGKAENVQMPDIQKVKEDNLFTIQKENIEEPHKGLGNGVHYEDDHWHHDDDAILLHSEVTSHPHEAHLELKLQKEGIEASPQGDNAPKKKKTSKFPFNIFQK